MDDLCPTCGNVSECPVAMAMETTHVYDFLLGHVLDAIGDKEEEWFDGIGVTAAIIACPKYEEAAS